MILNPDDYNGNIYTINNSIDNVSINKYDIVSYVIFYLTHPIENRKKKIKIVSHDILDKPNITVKVELDQRIRHGKHFGV